MAKFIKILKAPRVIVTVGFVFLVALLWMVLGWWLDKSALVCLIATCVLLLFYIAYLLWDQATASKRAADLERSIWEQSEEQKLSVRPDKREEIENLRRQLGDSIQQLKKSKLARGKSGGAALYALPWYLIIGPPGAGKTTTIRNSGLEFPFGTDREIQGVGGTRNCDWWFSNSAIVLDTAGRYTTEDDDQQEWFAFLDTLKKNRRREPLNGVLVCISIAELVGATPDELDFHAKTIRKRLDELTQRLGIRFPVYLLFTKCDLLSGFVDFFGELSRSQREQVWGCTFTSSQLDDPHPKAIFDREFDLLYESVQNVRFNRVSPAVKRESRTLIYSFPIEFRSAKENLSYLIGKVFQPNPYQEAPVFRGFYFTSGTQEGVPIDKVVQSVAQAFGLTPHVAQQFSPEIQTKSYFIKQVFDDVIIPGDKYVRLNARAARRQRWMRIGIAGGGVLALALVILGMTWGYFNSTARLDATAADIELSMKTPSTVFDPFPKLNPILRQIKLHQDSRTLAFGMDRSNAVLTPLRRVYYRELAPFVQASFLKPLQEKFASQSDKSADAYDDLKAYLLLTKETAQLNTDTTNRSFLLGRFMKMIDPGVGARGKEHLQFLASDFGEAVAESLVHPFPADERAIAAARMSAGRLDVRAVYENLKRKVNGIPPYVFMTNPVLRAKQSVRGVFTREGALQMEESIKNGDPTDLGAEAKWVLGVQAAQSATPAKDRPETSDSLRAVYFREYATEWWGLLNSIEAVPFDNLADAATYLNLLADPRNSLIKRLADDVLKNTTFEVPQGTGILDKAQQKIDKFVGSTNSMHPVDREFREFHQFVESDPERGKASELDGLIGALARVAEEMQALNAQPPKEAKKYALGVLTESAGLSQAMKSARVSLKARDDRTRRALLPLFEQPLRSSWAGVLSRLREHLNEEWKRNVYEPFGQIRVYYPFDPGSQHDAPISDVADVFSETGKLGKFVSEELSPFLDENDNWSGRRWGDAPGLEISPSAKQALSQVKTLSSSLFKGKDVQMKVTMSLDRPSVPEGADRVDKIAVTIGGVRKEFSWEEDKSVHSPGTFEWPGEGGAFIEAIVSGGGIWPFKKSDEIVDKVGSDGEWGLFRLVGLAQRTSGSRTDLKCKWTFKNGVTLVGSVRTDKGTNSPFSRGISLNMPERLS